MIQRTIKKDGFVETDNFVQTILIRKNKRQAKMGVKTKRMREITKQRSGVVTVRIIIG